MIEPEKTGSFFNCSGNILPRIATRSPWNQPLIDKKLFSSQSHAQLKFRFSQERDAKECDLRFTFYCKGKQPGQPQRKINSSQEHGEKRLKFVEKGPQQRLIKKLFQRRPHFGLRPLNRVQND